MAHRAGRAGRSARRSFRGSAAAAAACSMRPPCRAAAFWLAVLVLIIPALVGASEPPSGLAAPFPAEQTWAEIEPEILTRDFQPVKRTVERREANSEREARPGVGGSWLRTGGSLAAVVALIVLLAWGYRAVTPGGLPLARTRHPGLIEVVSRLGLSPRHALFLVRVGPRLVLCGVSPERISVLDTIDDPDLATRLAGQAAAARPDSSLADFHRCLESAERVSGHEEDGSAIHSRGAGSGETRLGAARQSLLEAIQRLRGVAGAG